MMHNFFFFAFHGIIAKQLSQDQVIVIAVAIADFTNQTNSVVIINDVDATHRGTMYAFVGVLDGTAARFWSSWNPFLYRFCNRPVCIVYCVELCIVYCVYSVVLYYCVVIVYYVVCCVVYCILCIVLCMCCVV